MSETTFKIGGKEYEAIVAYEDYSHDDELVLVKCKKLPIKEPMPVIELGDWVSDGVSPGYVYGIINSGVCTWNGTAGYTNTIRNEKIIIIRKPKDFTWNK